MHHMRVFSVIILLLVLSLVTSACGSAPTQAVDFANVTPEVVVLIPTTPPAPTLAIATEEPPTPTAAQKHLRTSKRPISINPPSSITRGYRLKPGTQLVYEGDTEDNGVMVPHRLVITVSDMTKVINGVRSVITFDEDFKQGQMVESELAFYAQDKKGNVWRMGEHPEEYQNGEYVEAPTWFAGVNGSVPGIEMLGSPTVGTPSYSQGWAPSVEFTDRGKVAQVGQQVCVPADCYNDVLVIDETSQAEPGAHQLKLFARWRGQRQG